MVVAVFLERAILRISSKQIEDNEKIRFEFMMNHKKLLIGCGCALLAIALVVCLVLVIGNGAGEKPTLPSNGTTQGTTPDGTSTNPTDGTTTPTGPD